jgi:hypothetical protein
MGHRNTIVAYAEGPAYAHTVGFDIDAYPAAVLECVTTRDFEPGAVSVSSWQQQATVASVTASTGSSVATAASTTLDDVLREVEEEIQRVTALNTYLRNSKSAKLTDDEVTQVLADLGLE